MHVIVHIGQPKAGSSAIQMALRAEGEGLRQQGVRVGPLQRTLSLALHGNDVVHNVAGLRLKYGSMDKARAESEEAWKRFAHRIETDRPPIVLLSSEHFLESPQALLTRLRKLFEKISILCYVREPVSHYVSAIDQQIRGGDALEVIPPPGERPFRMPSRIRSYKQHIGQDELVIRNFDRANLEGGDVVLDFFEQVSRLAGREIAPQHPPKRTNESLCGAATAWMLTLNSTFRRQTADPVSVKLRQSLIAHLRAADSLKDLPRVKLTDPVLVNAIRSATAEDCRWLNETVLQGQVPLEVGEPGPAPDPAELRARMQDWLMSYLTPEATALVAREVLAHRPVIAPAAKAGKTPAAKTA